MKYHYADASNQPAGPSTLEEIRALAASGTISADPLVVPEGGTEWKPLSVVSPPVGVPIAPPPPPKAPGASFKLPAATIVADAIGAALTAAARTLKPEWVGRSLALARDIGHYVVLLGGVLGLIYAIYVAIRHDSFGLVMMGIGMVLILAVAQFAAKCFLGAGEKLISTTPSHISSTAFLDCLGLLALLGAVFMLIAGFVSAIQLRTGVPLIPAVLGFVFWVHAAALALHPTLVNVEAGEGSAGEEGIGLLTFFLKAGLKLVPLFFFLLAVLGALIIILGFFNSGYALQRMLPIPSVGGPAGFAGVAAIIAACLMPMVAYLVFLLQYLIFDLIRAVLAIPGKLDALKR